MLKQCLVCQESLTSNPSSHQSFPVHTPNANKSLLKHSATEVCANPHCRNIIKQQHQMTEVQFSSYLALQQKLVREKKEKERHFASKKSSQILCEKNEAEALLDQYRNDQPSDELHYVEIVTLPTGKDQITYLSQQRKDRYLEHLNNIINQAFETKSIEDLVKDEHFDAYEKRIKMDRLLKDNEELSKTCDNLCMMCEGGCCVSAGTHSYLSTATIKRFMESHPSLSKDDIKNKYLNYLPEKSVEDSCVHQTDTGCALPRNLRSDICNGYFCEPIKKLQKHHLDNAKPLDIFAVQRRYQDPYKFNENIDKSVRRIGMVNSKGIKIVSRNER